MAHTLGPWRFERPAEYPEQCRILNIPVEDHRGYFRHNDGSWVVIDSADGPAPVASVSFRGKAKRGEGWKAPDPEGQANARLISAAPELLEAVKSAVAWLDSIEKRLGLEMIDLMPNGSLGRPAMLRAIAKATGAKAEGRQ